MKWTNRILKSRCFCPSSLIYKIKILKMIWKQLIKIKIIVIYMNYLCSPKVGEFITIIFCMIYLFILRDCTCFERKENYFIVQWTIK